MFSCVSPEARVAVKHPLRPIRSVISEALAQMDGPFARLYAQTGRPSIAPERLIQALLLIEQLEYNLLFRWFVGQSVDESVWYHSTFSRNEVGSTQRTSCMLFGRKR